MQSVNLSQPQHSFVVTPSVEGVILDTLLGERPYSEVQSLLERHLQITEQSAERLIRQMMVDINNRMFPPITHIELIHTEGCNLGCTYCFEKDMLGYRRMSPETARAAVDMLFDYSLDAQHLRLLHFGGEPTLNFTGIRVATEYAEQRAKEAGKSIDFDMTSNGMLLDDKMIDYCAEHRIKVLLSIDGLAPSHDTFRIDKRGRPTFTRVIDAMRRLKQKQPWIGVKMTVMPVNAHRLLADVQGLHELGVNQFIVGYATGVNWTTGDMETYTDQMALVQKWYEDAKSDQLRISDFDDASTQETRFGCQAGKTSVTIAVDGEISPCSKILALNNKILVGKLGDVRHGITQLKTRAELVTCSRLKAQVEELGITSEFRGGCFASNYQDNLDLHSPNLQDHRLSVMQRAKCKGCAPHL